VGYCFTVGSLFTALHYGIGLGNRVQTRENVVGQALTSFKEKLDTKSYLSSKQNRRWIDDPTVTAVSLNIINGGKVKYVVSEKIADGGFLAYSTFLLYSLHSGQKVTIFANNKKKRLRQALYASPTKTEQTEAFEDLSKVTSMNSHNEWNDGDDCFETNDTQKQSFPRPQKSNSIIKVGSINDSLLSACFSSQQSHLFNGHNCIGNNRKGLQVPTPQSVKQERQLHHNNSVDSATNSTSFNYNDVRFANNSAAFSFFIVLF